MSENEKTALEMEFEKAEAAAKEANAKRSGIGTRLQVGKTRGKSPIVISFEQFDSSIADSLPTSIEKFMEVTTVKDEPTLVGYLIDGYNQALYTAASDPIAEFVNDTWSPEVQTQFRLVVRNYSRGANVSLEDAVALIKPGFDKQFTK